MAGLSRNGGLRRPDTTSHAEAARLRLEVIDAHTAGEPFRVLVSGVDPIPGDSMLAKRAFAQEHLEPVRRALMWEPRGHADMYGCFLTDPVTPDADLGVLFLHNEGYSTMCGHGIIALGTVLVETGMIAATGQETALAIDTPAGLVRATVLMSGDRVTGVRFTNVPAYAADLDSTVSVSGTGTVRYDLAFGGAYYAFVDADQLGVALMPPQAAELIRLGRDIKQAVVRTRAIAHPVEADLGFLYGVIFTGAAAGPDRHSRHVCIFADGEVDRSPTGTGVSARLALLAARGTLAAGTRILIESILGTVFGGTIAGPAMLGAQPAVTTVVDGAAFITGRSEFWLDPRDPTGSGFLIR